MARDLHFFFLKKSDLRFFVTRPTLFMLCDLLQKEEQKASYAFFFKTKT